MVVAVRILLPLHADAAMGRPLTQRALADGEIDVKLAIQVLVEQLND